MVVLGFCGDGVAMEWLCSGYVGFLWRWLRWSGYGVAMEWLCMLIVALGRIGSGCAGCSLGLCRNVGDGAAGECVGLGCV